MSHSLRRRETTTCTDVQLVFSPKMPAFLRRDGHRTGSVFFRNNPLYYTSSWKRYHLDYCKYIRLQPMQTLGCVCLFPSFFELHSMYITMNTIFRILYVYHVENCLHLKSPSYLPTSPFFCIDRFFVGRQRRTKAGHRSSMRPGDLSGWETSEATKSSNLLGLRI